MRIRPAGSFFTLHESMERMVEVKSLQELKDHIKNVYEDTFNLDTLQCRFYCDDSRIGWHTYLITADYTDGTYKQQAVVFADGPMEDLPAVVINAPLNIEPPKRRFILVKEYDGKSSYLDADKKWKPSPFQKIEDCTVFTCSLLEAREKAFLAMSLVTDPNEKPRIYPVELIDSANEEGGIFFRPLK